MPEFRGYLLKATKTDTIFPNVYIAYDTWNSQPKNREEIKAYRDENTRDLIRVTARGTKSAFSFSLREGLHLRDIEIIRNFFVNGSADELQRKIRLQYWNDETLRYETSDFYIANYTPKIKKMTNDDIIYNELELNFIEY